MRIISTLVLKSFYEEWKHDMTFMETDKKIWDTSEAYVHAFVRLSIECERTSPYASLSTLNSNKKAAMPAVQAAEKITKPATEATSRET